VFCKERFRCLLFVAFIKHMSTTETNTETKTDTGTGTGTVTSTETSTVTDTGTGTGTGTDTVTDTGTGTGTDTVTTTSTDTSTTTTSTDTNTASSTETGTGTNTTTNTDTNTNTSTGTGTTTTSESSSVESAILQTIGIVFYALVGYDLICWLVALFKNLKPLCGHTRLISVFGILLLLVMVATWIPLNLFADAPITLAFGYIWLIILIPMAFLATYYAWTKPCTVLSFESKPSSNANNVHSLHLDRVNPNTVSLRMELLNPWKQLSQLSPSRIAQ